jgi:hypothetical protein
MGVFVWRDFYRDRCICIVDGRFRRLIGWQAVTRAVM